MADPDQNNNTEAEVPAQDPESVAESAGAESVDDAAAQGAEAPDTNGPVSIESLQAALAIANEESLKFKDAVLRAEAEMENVRRRANRDVENAHKFGLEKFMQSLVPVVDSLEKAAESALQASEEGANKAIADGVGLCLKMLMDELGKQGVAVIDPNGEPFDPNLHQAMSMVENPDVEPNSVVAVIQKGYTLNDRLVRPAMVMVAKGTSPKIDEQA